MTGKDRSEPEGAPGTALVLSAQACSMNDPDAIGAAKIASTRADPGFLAHLIATAEQAPQTRLLRRATPADAQNAYTAAPAHAAFHGRQVVRV
jgi:hypothetical protein